MVYDLIVVGGGAAGFYGAIQAAEMKKANSILIVEKSPKLLSKVKVSGGGRCNVTHHCYEAAALSKHYPRGEKFLKSVFKVHQPTDVVNWFKSKNVELKIEEDGRMFPTTDDSQTIIDCFMREAYKHNMKIVMSDGVVNLLKADQFELTTQSGNIYYGKNVLVATGGSSSVHNYQWLVQFGHQIVLPIPSLFTFNDAEKSFKDLMGLSVPNAYVKIAGAKLSSQGPLLITHWGLSGPAIIRLSAWAAEYLYKLEYNFTALVSWIGDWKEEELRSYLVNYKQDHGKQKILNHALFSLPQRLWLKLCAMADIDDDKIWAELPQKNINKLLEYLLRCQFQIKGKTTFKEEFVTCGGVDLKEVNVETMESKKINGLYFAGEVLNIDGETGGFNFQAAWSTAYLAVKSIE